MIKYTFINNQFNVITQNDIYALIKYLLKHFIPKISQSDFMNCMAFIFPCVINAPFLADETNMMISNIYCLVSDIELMLDNCIFLYRTFTAKN